MSTHSVCSVCSEQFYESVFGSSSSQRRVIIQVHLCILCNCNKYYRTIRQVVVFAYIYGDIPHSYVQTLSSALTFPRNVISTRTNLFFRLTLLQYTHSEFLPTCGSLRDTLIYKVHKVKLFLCFNHRGTGVWRGKTFLCIYIPIL
jgi:hypothetical protein